MIRFFGFLWSGCFHKWKIIKEGPVFTTNGEKGIYYHLQCEKCGNLKFRDAL